MSHQTLADTCDDVREKNNLERNVTSSSHRIYKHQPSDFRY